MESSWVVHFPPSNLRTTPLASSSLGFKVESSFQCKNTRTRTTFPWRRSPTMPEKKHASATSTTTSLTGKLASSRGLRSFLKIINLIQYQLFNLIPCDSLMEEKWKRTTCRRNEMSVKLASTTTPKGRSWRLPCWRRHHFPPDLLHQLQPEQDHPGLLRRLAQWIWHYARCCSQGHEPGVPTSTAQQHSPLPDQLQVQQSCFSLSSHSSDLRGRRGDRQRACGEPHCRHLATSGRSRPGRDPPLGGGESFQEASLGPVHIWHGHHRCSLSTQMETVPGQVSTTEVPALRQGVPGPAKRFADD